MCEVVAGLQPCTLLIYRPVLSARGAGTAQRGQDMTNTSINGVIVGVDTHKSAHVAVAIDLHGAKLATYSVPANTKGYGALEDWATSLGKVEAFGIEGTGSYGDRKSTRLKSSH